MEIPVAASGAITVALIVVLGIFGYPALLRRPRGRVLVGLATIVLALLFFLFDRSSGLSGHPVLSGSAIAVLPLLAGALVHRLQRGSSR